MPNIVQLQLLDCEVMLLLSVLYNYDWISFFDCWLDKTNIWQTKFYYLTISRLINFVNNYFQLYVSHLHYLLG